MNESNLFISNEKAIKIKQKMFYLLRVCPPNTPVNMNDNDVDLIQGEIQPQILNQLSQFMTFVFQPMIENLDQDYWGHCSSDQKEEFIKYNKEFT